jgi:2-C-methyl-D-erythritol 4-phosphate cytidylyltransferase
VNKVYAQLAGRPVLAWSVEAADRARGVTRLVLVVRAEDEPTARRLLADHPATRPVDVVVGGTTRHDSEAAGLAHLEPDVRAGRIDVVAVHDGARPLAGRALFEQVLAAAAEHGGALPGVPARGLVTARGGPTPDHVVPGTRIVRVQTPQAFRAVELLDAYAQAARNGFRGTDTAACVEAFTDLEVHVVPGRQDNLKITYPGDLARAEALLQSAS